MGKPLPGRRPGRPAAAGEMVGCVLRRGIVTGAIPGGTRLVQSAVAAEFAVSTGPVRDALRELAAGGFVRFGADGVAVVRQLGRAELADVFEIRKLLEPVAVARTAACGSRDAILQAAELLTAMHGETDRARWVEHNDRFHRVLSEAASSPRLAAILANLRDLTSLYVTHSITAEPDRARRGSAEHEEILRAVVARDPEAAAEATFRHLDGRLAALLEVHQVGDPRRCRPAG
jgi:DNA-binding GntR family transcriptional regulator